VWAEPIADLSGFPLRRWGGQRTIFIRKLHPSLAKPTIRAQGGCDSRLHVFTIARNHSKNIKLNGTLFAESCFRALLRDNPTIAGPNLTNNVRAAGIAGSACRCRLAVRPKGANHLWRKNPPASCRLVCSLRAARPGNRKGWSLVTKAALGV
jgi:hypothetical protein